MKRDCLLFVLGIVATLVFFVWLGGERDIQLSLKLAAASADYDFQAVPRAAIAQAETVPTARKGRR